MILAPADQLEQNLSTIADVHFEGSVVWKNLFCHRIVLRAASSFCDRIISNKFTHDRMEVGEGIERVIADNENDGRTSQQVLLYRIIITQGSKFLLNFFYENSASVVKK